ncbi:Diacylglycerol O-acyltransferase 2-like protein 6, partial [Eschrichtius robustus]|nr:Diacylglycerol O-acyltransferase 2-like protein 6 [Eschrichtius robustus]
MLCVLALAWLAYDWNTHSELVKTHDLCPKHNYIIANHPHGILSYGVFINFATEATGFAQNFPAITLYVGTLEGIFWIPIV